ncbi:hypothetical protein ACFWDI_31505 [Streptomyces sp. NPDC060064]|uniref:hypothetical protein n=1 Tax=Streptomyces sp. NPDC060064 TaxID=3347049 RepID=UPI0036A7C67B
MAVVVLGAAAGCSSDNGGKDAMKGKPVADVCDGFAKDAPALNALRAIVGDGDFADDRSLPDETLKALREADGELTTKELASGTPLCRLQAAKDGESALDIDFREALVVPKGRDRPTFSYFITGEDALSANRFAKILFECRMKEPAKKIIVAAELERSNKSEASEKDLPGLQITVLNAAARKVAAELGCQNDTKLVSGVPKPAA